MAERIVVDLVDDIDGHPAVETVTFGIDGLVYEIDLSVANSVQLRSAFEPYIAAARKVPDPRLTQRGLKSRRIVADQTLAEKRRWAKDNGWPVADRGRIPDDVLAAYNAAHPS